MACYKVGIVILLNIVVLWNVIQGATDATGATGPTGPTGPTGAHGINGATGPTGPAGLNGINGENGLNGENGFNGINGATGATGPAGLNGINGATGATGPAGSAGLNGINGATGATGPAGLNGINGATGPTGPPGLNGINGATGATGPAGLNGIIGTPVYYTSQFSIFYNAFCNPSCSEGQTTYVSESCAASGSSGFLISGYCEVIFHSASDGSVSSLQIPPTLVSAGPGSTQPNQGSITETVIVTPTSGTQVSPSDSFTCGWSYTNSAATVGIVLVCSS